MGCLGDSAGSIEPILVLSEVFVGDQEIDDAPAGIPSVKGGRFIFSGVVSGDAGAGSDENRTCHSGSYQGARDAGEPGDLRALVRRPYAT